MGIYCGLAPGGTLRTWRHEAARLRVLLGHPDLPSYMRDAAQTQLNDLKRVIERHGDMSQQNTNKQTPRPPFDPPSQATHNGLDTDVGWAILSADEYAFWLALDKPGPLEFARRLARREGLRALQQKPHDAPATGPTTRLATYCRACGDELPPDAVYCIICRSKV